MRPEKSGKTLDSLKESLLSPDLTEILTRKLSEGLSLCLAAALVKAKHQSRTGQMGTETKLGYWSGGWWANSRAALGPVDPPGSGEPQCGPLLQKMDFCSEKDLNHLVADETLGGRPWR